jgi:hypothetical protein
VVKEKTMMKKNEMFQCPKCLEFDTDCTDYYFDEVGLEIKCSCNQCDAVWKEYATISYDGYMRDKRRYDKDGNEIANWEGTI